MNTNITNTIKIAGKNDPVIAAMDAELQHITAIDLHTFIFDHDTLAAALYADDPYRCEDLIEDAPTDDIYSVACFAMDMLNEPLLRDDVAYNGFFSDTAKKLLEIAKTCYNYGARLTRILLLFCLKSELYNIDPDVDDALYDFLKKFKDEHHYMNLPVPELFLSEEQLLELQADC